jgi:hypothetical protein
LDLLPVVRTLPVAAHLLLEKHAILLVKKRVLDGFRPHHLFPGPPLIIIFFY